MDKLAINYTVSTLTLLVVYISWLIYIIILDQLRLRHVSTYRGPKAGLPLIRQLMLRQFPFDKTFFARCDIERSSHSKVLSRSSAESLFCHLSLCFHEATWLLFLFTFVTCQTNSIVSEGYHFFRVPN